MLLEVQNLKISYRNFIFVDDVSFYLKEGEIFSIAGESGSGKTLTALSIINLLPDYFKCEGSVIFKGKNILNLPSHEVLKIRGRQISFIFQDPLASLNPVLKAGYQVMEMFIHHYKSPKRAALEKTEELFKKLKIQHIINSYPHQLSGGMRQRVMIAMALACSPELIIADEPTTALDVTIQEEVLDLLYLLAKEEGKTLILITHDINIVGEYTDRVMIMYAGRIMEMGSVQEIFRNPLHPYTIALLNCVPSEEKKIKGIPGNIPDLKNLPSGCLFNPRCKYKRHDCIYYQPTIKEITEGHWVRCFLH